MSRRRPIEVLPPRLPEIALNHGRALWVLVQLGFQGDAPASTFNEYLKSLRKLGIPFAPGDIGLAHRGLANYSYCHVMELALALTLRVYHVLPDAVLGGIIRYRRVLHRHYRRAYAERSSGLGAPRTLHTNGEELLTLRGVFVDLQINYSGGRLTSFGPPSLLSPSAAVGVLTQRDVAGRALVPINLSALAERVVELALRAPAIRRGPLSRSR